MSEEQLLRYVREAIAIQDSGQTLDLQELCSDAPELIEAVGETLALDSLVTSSSADGLVGQTLNERYTLRRCIGIGAMGTVYEADDLSLHRVVAVKLLPPGTFVEQRRRDRFRREAQVLAALNHPNIVSVYDHGRTEHGLHYLVMERLQGSSMASLVNPQHTSAPPSRPRIGWLAGELGLPVQSEDYIPQVVIWMLEVIEALHAAHTAGICHRDVKPSNVFLTRDGRAVLLDFGIAARSGDASMTTRGSALGTPAYMAPEQVARDGEASPTMDAYGVCATLYHLVSMQPPYTGDSLEVLAKLTCEDPRPLKSIDPRLPTDLCAIIEKGLERSAGR